ncbi:OLC1v1006088C1 [Oldenlandia corymbosa var. corymbosa]|uniref:OLC1v1006088C1 n=1 Tax=Oldenlandia corymbosa var. corymbosa TaxID=529605 RepID=A0AAV1DIM6_OLDCO|nr:OLC1v1006088C1 [Oldenlandia corymbosa var. corymbosa]
MDPFGGSPEPKLSSSCSTRRRIMDARQHHASLGRRTLEEIRQKRAAERLSKAASGPDLTQVPISSSSASESGTRLGEVDISSLVSQLKELQKRNNDLDEENKSLSSQLRSKEIENDMLQKRLNDLDQNTVPSLRKALKDVAMEKDAAVVSREDLSAQLRAVKKRLKEAEEEQYRAEEDAAALRAELNSLHQQAMSGPTGGMPSTSYSPDHVMVMERELSNLKTQLEQESRLRQQDQQRLADEQVRISTLISEKQDLEEKLALSAQRVSGETTENANIKGFTEEDKERLEKQLHEMAVAVERLEISRQKLLMEIDSQSSEIERLFEENSNLSSAYEEANKVVEQWENQVKDCLTQNDELRSLLHKYRMEQAGRSTINGNAGITESSKEENGSLLSPEITSLKTQLANEQSRVEALSAETLQLSARLQQATQAYNGLARLYKPVLRNIENSLIKMKQDGSVAA